LFAREIVDDCFQDCKMADPATKVGGGDFSNIWNSSLITGSLL